jgi:hypothetical protein
MITTNVAKARVIACASWMLLTAGCAQPGLKGPGTSRLAADHEAIEVVLEAANRGFELSDADLFAGAFAEDAVYKLPGTGPVFGYEKMIYRGRAEIRQIIGDRVEKARRTDPKTLSYDPATLRRYNRNSDSVIEMIDAAHARHSSTWMVVMKTNVNIHISAVGRYEDELEKRNGRWLITQRLRIE